LALAGAGSLLGKAAGAPHYVGSKACEMCHPAIYARWEKTPMANVVRDPRTHPDAIVADFSHPPSFVKFTTQEIALVYGSIWKQRYFKKVGDNYYVLPAQWDIKTRKWLPYFVEKGEDWWTRFYPPGNMQRPTGPLCDGCHSVNYNIETHTVTEWNVGCERCHGPGSEHIKDPVNHLHNIINPARLDYVDATNVCIQCHAQGRPLHNPINGQYYDWPVGFQVGRHLQDYWRLEQNKLGVTDFYFFADGTAHKNRMQSNDFVESLMYRHGVTCFSCHDVHGTDHAFELRRPVAAICLECHGPNSPNGPYTSTLEEHTHHPAGSPGSECVSCHMPEIQKEGVPGGFVHVHTFRFITPAMTEKYGIPNPCIACHKERTNSWATEWLSRWFSPWRTE
jgi:predicted CXXCH cytochrome family protein